MQNNNIINRKNSNDKYNSLSILLILCISIIAFNNLQTSNYNNNNSTANLINKSYIQNNSIINNKNDTKSILENGFIEFINNSFNNKVEPYNYLLFWTVQKSAP